MGNGEPSDGSLTLCFEFAGVFGVLVCWMANLTEERTFPVAVYSDVTELKQREEELSLNGRRRTRPSARSARFRQVPSPPFEPRVRHGTGVGDDCHQHVTPIAIRVVSLPRC